MRFEILRERKVIKRGDEILNKPVWTNELMEVPSTIVKLPITYHDHIRGREEFKLFIDDKCFWGIVLKVVEDKEKETMDVHLEHVIYEWTYRQISVNNAIKDKHVNIVFKGAKTETQGNDNVSASPFTMLLEEVGTFTDKHYIERAGASGWTGNGETLNVSVNSKVKSEAGDYDVTFTAGQASVTVKATVVENDNKTEKDDYTLTASDFSMYGNELPLTDDEWIRRANAKIEPSLPLTVDASAVKSTSGQYSVKFSATYEKEGEEQEITVSVTVIVTGEGEEPAIADNIADIFADMNFAYPGWRLNMSDNAANTNIDYVYSRQNKLEALTKTCELTDDLYWRVRFVNEKVVDISEFGEKKQYIFSTKPTGKKNIRLLSAPRITHEYDKVINLATVYSEKSDSGMSSMTLREVYENPSLQIDGFPVVILRANVNNERDYRKYTDPYPKLAPNNWLEYAIIDEESVAMEAGEVIEGTYAFNDLAPFSIVDDDGETRQITDNDRIEAATTAYHAAIKKLKEARRRYKIEFDVETVPVDLNVGDRVRLLYDNTLLIMDNCTKYLKHILSFDDWYYLTEVKYDHFSGYSVTLEKQLHTDREIHNE